MVLGTFGIPITLVTFGVIGVYLKRIVHFSLFHLETLVLNNPPRDDALNGTTVIVSVVICWVYIFGEFVVGGRLSEPWRRYLECWGAPPLTYVP